MASAAVICWRLELGGLNGRVPGRMDGVTAPTSPPPGPGTGPGPAPCSLMLRAAGFETFWSINTFLWSVPKKLCLPEKHSIRTGRNFYHIKEHGVLCVRRNHKGRNFIYFFF